jgi:glutamate--cysteine ligase
MTVQSPAVLNDISIKTFPETRLGWHLRKKINHFIKYEQIVSEFCNNFKIDPWFFSALFDGVDDVDFKDHQGIESTAQKVENLIKKITLKYDQYDINIKPSVYIKANAGTYGMGVVMVQSPDDVLNINKTNRNKLDSIKAGVKSTSFLLQEGVPSITKIDNNPAEIVCYGFNLRPCDFFYRYHPEKDEMNSLNAPGARFINKNDFGIVFDKGFENNKDQNQSFLKLAYIASNLAFIACGIE